MSKNVLIMMGSARAKGNTNTLAAAFASGAQAAGNKVEFFNAAACNMDGCHGDQSCFERGYCGLQDDGVKMHELMCWADVLVLASPVYWSGFTAQLKRVIDRFYQFSAPKGRAACTVKETYLISTAANPDPKMFDSITGAFDQINQLLHFTKAGQLLVSGIAGPDDIKAQTNYMKKAVEMGYRV